MYLRGIKNSAELVLAGVEITPEYHNSSLHSILLKDATGRVLKLEVEYSSLKALIPAEPKTEEKQVVVGTIAKIPVREVFDDIYEATKRKHELEEAGGDVDVKTEEVEIPF